jgi:hypothetical protein
VSGGWRWSARAFRADGCRDGAAGQRLRDTLQYTLTTLAEESLEMLGLILFIHTLLRYMRGPGANAVDVSLEPR